MTYIIIVIAFLFGLIIGSFLNVVAYRLNSKSLSGRSMCMSCGKTLTWKELIPVCSFFYQKGKCKKCKTKISIQYPIVEVVTGIVFSLTAIALFSPLDFSIINDVQFLIYIVIASVLIVLSVYDIKHFIIPNILLWLLFGLYIILLLVPGIPPSFSFLSILAGPIVALPFFLIWLLSHGEWIGFGDVKLALIFGFLLGLSSGFAMLIISIWIGAIVGIVFVLITKKKSLKVKIPFGPFLAIGGFLSILYNINTSTILNWFM